MIYDQYQPYIKGMTQPEGITFKCDIISADGHVLSNQKVNQYTLGDLKNVVAVRFHKPVDPIADLARRIVGEYAGQYSSKYAEGQACDRTAVVLNWLNNHGMLKVHDEPLPKPDPKDWLEYKLDELGYRKSTDRAAIRNWFEKPDKYPEVNMNIGNNILTVKPVAGGRVVVTPVGHTIAYSTAQKIWYAINGYDEYSMHSNWHKPTVGVYEGRRRYNYSSSNRLTIQKDGVKIGCQFVPMRAIKDLADRENWTNKPTY